MKGAANWRALETDTMNTSCRFAETRLGKLTCHVFEALLSC